MGRQEVQNLLDNFRKSHPKVVEELVPDLLNLGTVMRVLQNLLREHVSIRDLRSILETLADWAPASQDPDQLTEHVRRSMARSICSGVVAGDGVLPVLTFARDVEARIQDAIQHSGQGSYLALDPATAQNILSGLGEVIQQYAGGDPVLLCPPTIRPHVKRLTERYLPNLMVISHNEVAPDLKIRAVGTVKAHAG
ncbi:FHIPEP family type III secretion protein [Geoalkalibacter sp.]|uniref:FHIPEP family type III secretion protein n=1 Tax=Geoalkalibacter sp. TaxID=3041440 RepID=UPI003FA5CEA7